MKNIVGVSDMKVSACPGDIIVTHSLGSCIGISIYDPVAMVGGILHYQLPDSRSNPGKAGVNPFMFADTGIPQFFKVAYSLGAEKKRLIVKAAGGSSLLDTNGYFNIGHKNHVAMKKIFWKNGVLVEKEDVGGEGWRTMRLEIGTGIVRIKNGVGEYVL